MRISKPQLVNVTGSGYAGIECALFLAGHGIKVHLFDDEKTYQFDELSQKFECNSTKKRKIFEKVLFKELRLFGSPLARIEVSDDEFLTTKHCMEMFRRGKELLLNNPNVQIFQTNIHEINPNEITVIATGHSTNERLMNFLSYYFGNMNCFSKMMIYPKILFLKSM